MKRSASEEPKRHAKPGDALESAALSEAVGPSSSEKNRLRIWFFFGLFVPLLGMSPLLVLQMQSLIVQQRFLFFPIPIIVGVLLFFRTGGYRIASGVRAKIAVGLALLGIGIAVLGTFWFSPWIVQFASVVVIFAWALGAFAGTAWTRIFSLCCLFAVAIPPPSGVDALINTRLQTVAGWGCNGFLDAIWVPNIVEGNVLQIADKKVKLSEISGGPDSFAALLAIGMALVVLRRSTLLVALATVASIPVFYVLGSLIRLVAIAIGFENFEVDLSMGTGFINCAIMVSLGTIAAVILTHISIAAILEPISTSKGANNLTALYRLMTSWPNTKEWSPQLLPESAEKPGGAPIGRNGIVLVAVPSLICILIGGAAGYVAISSARTKVSGVRFSEERASILPSQSAFPSQFGSMRMTGFTPTVHSATNPLGRYSNLWKFEDKGSQVFVTLDFPLQSWRPVWTGYQSSGWKILGVKPVEVPAEAGIGNLHVEEVAMQNPYGLYGFIWYAFFDDQGVPTIEDKELGGGRLNIIQRLQKNPSAASKAYLQVQLFLESGRELTERETQANRKLFFEIYERLRQQSEVALKQSR